MQPRSRIGTRHYVPGRRYQRDRVCARARVQNSPSLPRQRDTSQKRAHFTYVTVGDIH
jgi:hypothetical protein